LGRYKLLRNPVNGATTYQKFLSADYGWKYINFEARLMKKGDNWEGNTGENEYGFILLGGNYSIESDKGKWETLNGGKRISPEEDKDSKKTLRESPGSYPFVSFALACENLKYASFHWITNTFC